MIWFKIISPWTIKSGFCSPLNTFTVEAGKPVKWTIIGDHVTGCSNEIIQADFGIDVPLETGEVKSVFFTPEKKGKYTFSCWMEMLFGEINVV